MNSDNSVVLKMITIYNKEADTVEEVLLEELQVFKVIRSPYSLYIETISFLLETIFTLKTFFLILGPCSYYRDPCLYQKSKTFS